MNMRHTYHVHLHNLVEYFHQKYHMKDPWDFGTWLLNPRNYKREVLSAPNPKRFRSLITFTAPIEALKIQLLFQKEHEPFRSFTPKGH
jgi:hypothetical protein